jgi:hypothetical protein
MRGSETIAMPIFWLFPKDYISAFGGWDHNFEIRIGFKGWASQTQV